MKNRPYTWILVLILVIVVAAFAYHLSAILNEKKEIPHEGNYSSQEIINIIKPEIDKYCKTLNDNAIHSGCPTCTSYVNDKNESYVYVNNLSEDTSNIHSYTIQNDGSSYNVEMKLHLIYGRNDRPGSALLTFKIDENGTIISKDLPVKGCV
jgi:hypothetical protein